MKIWKLFYNPILVSTLVVLTLAGCTSNYSIAQSLQARGRYAAAVERYDDFIRIAKNGAKSTEAELARSECYYQLGMKSFTTDKWKLAIRFFFLANSDKADEVMDNCYFNLAQAAYDRKDFDITLSYYTMIVDNLPTSELIPEILHNRIQIFMDLKGDDVSAWANYELLNKNYPNSEFIASSQPYIDRFMNRYIDNAVELQYTEGYRVALERLFYLEQYPSSFKDRIYLELSELYWKLAEDLVDKGEYVQAEETYRFAIEFDPTKEEMVNGRLREICTKFMEEGDNLLKDRQIDQAIIMFGHCFNIIKDYEPAAIAISEANILKQKILEASRLNLEAQEAEKKEQWATALQLYRRAYKLDALQAYKDKAFLMSNMVEIEKDPIAFARRIVNNYRNGLIIRRVSQLEQEQTLQYGDLVSVTNWQYSRSIGEAKYEVRYEITTPDKSYYLVWLVNLKDQTVSPLSKVTEELMD